MKLMHNMHVSASLFFFFAHFTSESNSVKSCDEMWNLVSTLTHEREIHFWFAAAQIELY